MTQDKKVVILIVLGIGAVLSLIYGVVTPPKGRSAVSASKKALPTPQQEGQRGISGARSLNRRAKRTKFVSWKRSPFVPTGTPSAGSSLVLNGIVGTLGTPKAMIGGEIVGIGDNIGPNRVVAINADSVIINDGTEDFELKLERR